MNNSYNISGNNNGIYTVLWSDVDQDYCEVEYYTSGIELAVYHFLRYVYEKADISYLPTSIITDFTNIALNAKSNVLAQSFSVEYYTYSFLKSVSSDSVTVKYFELIVEEAKKLPTIVKVDEFEEFLQKNWMPIKHVTMCEDEHSTTPSMCTLEMPIAYLFASQVTKSGFYKEYVQPDLIETLLKKLKDETFYSFDDLENRLDALAAIDEIDPAMFKCMITCAMVKPMIRIWKANKFSAPLSRVWEEIYEIMEGEWIL